MFFFQLLTVVFLRCISIFGTLLLLNMSTGDDHQNVVLNDITNFLVPLKRTLLAGDKEKTSALIKLFKYFTKIELLDEIKDIIILPRIIKKEHTKGVIENLLVREVCEPKTREVYIYNLPKRRDFASVKKLFGNYGKVRLSYLEQDALILVISPEEGALAAAQALNESMYEGRKIKVEVSCTVYVYNLPLSTSANELANIFQEFGDVKYSEVAKCYGCVVLRNDAAAKSAVRELSGKTYKEHRLAVKIEKKRNVDGCISDLELRYQQLHCSQRQWTAIRIRNPIGKIDHSTSEVSFQKKFEKCLMKSILNCAVFSIFHHNVLWSMITIEKKGKLERAFLLCFKRIPIICYCNLRVGFVDDVHRAVLNTFGSTGKEIFPVKTKNLKELLMMCCDKAGIDQRFIPQLPETTKGVKRPVAEESEEEEEEQQVEEHPHIIDADREEDMRRKEYAKSISKKTGRIQKLVYNVESAFLGDFKKTKRIHTHSQAVLTGENLTQGLKDLIRLGILKYPLPPHLAAIQSNYCGTYHVKMKTVHDNDSDTSDE